MDAIELRRKTLEEMVEGLIVKVSIQEVLFNKLQKEFKKHYHIFDETPTYEGDYVPTSEPRVTKWKQR